MFWKSVKLLLSDKGINIRRIFFYNNNKVITEDTEVANTLNVYFETAVNSIGITASKYL